MGAQGGTKNPQKSAQISKKSSKSDSREAPFAELIMKNVLFWGTLHPRKRGSRLSGNTVFTVGTGPQKGTKNISKMLPFGHPLAPLGVQVWLLDCFWGVLKFNVF